MKKTMISLLYFSRQERRGAIVLLGLCIAVFLIPHFLPNPTLSQKDQAFIASKKEEITRKLYKLLYFFLNATEHIIY